MSDGVSLNSSLQSLAESLLASDKDKIITKSELESFIKSKDDEFAALNIDAATAADELEEILGDKYKADADDAKAADAKAATDDDIAAGYNRIKDKIDRLTTELEEYKKEKEQLEKKQKELSSDLETQNKKYEKTSQATKEQSEKFQKIVDQINIATEDMQDEMKQQQRHAAIEAMSAYDPNSDGDWQDFLENFVSSATSDNTYKSIISNLVSKSDLAELQLNNLNYQLTGQAQVVTNLDSELASVTKSLNSVVAKIDQTQIDLDAAQKELNDYILNLVSQEEMDFVTNNNIDLTETLPDGKPRYIFAPGQQDGKLHIYDMGNDGASLARQFGNGSGLKGTNVVPMGNGFIRNFKDLGECAEGGNQYYYIGKCGMNTGKACYCTCSPLGLDLDGDGYNLDTSKTINFDIDGDGKLDKINDSKEAILVFDADGDGKFGEDGKEVFGNNTDLSRFGINQKFNNGFEALNALADVAKKQGIIDGDSTLDEKELSKMEEAFGFKIKLGGYNSEATSLKDAGITSINLSNEKVSDKKQFDEFGNEIQTQKGATFTVNGKEREYADLWHRKYEDNAGGATGDKPSASAANSSNLFLAGGEYTSIVSKDLEAVTSKILDSGVSAQSAKIDYKNALKNVENMSEVNMFKHIVQKQDVPQEVEEEVEEVAEEEIEEEIKEEEKE